MTHLAHCLVGDIGGTNARFAVLDASGLPTQVRVLRTDDFPTLVAAIQAYLEDTGLSDIEAAAVAVATPVVGDAVKLTNNHWSFSIEHSRTELGLRTLKVTNDFTALALSIRDLPSAELEFVGRGEPKADRAIAVIGPGTGLGVSGLIPCAGQWSALQCEGGHVSMSVATPREFAICESMARRFRHVSAERFLSGPGLVNIVTAVRDLDGLNTREYSPAEVVQLGTQRFNLKNGLIEQAQVVTVDEQELRSCEEALEIFCHSLGSCAGNLALTLGAEGGVYIGGGIVPRLGDYFQQSGFRRAFETKGRMQDYLSTIPTYVIHAPYPALVGAARLLES